MTARFDLDLALRTHPCRQSMLQWRTELTDFCQFMLDHAVRRVLEIGTATGQLAVFLKAALGLELMASCDLYQPPLLAGRSDVKFFHGDHHSARYRTWRAALGAVDVVLIDADHETGFRGDTAIEREFEHRYLAFHDVANPAYPALRAFWEHEITGDKLLFVNRDPTIGFGVPELSFPWGPWPSASEYEARYGRCCGIGVVAAS